MPAYQRKYATATEAEIRALVAQGLTNDVIAAKLNLSPTALATTRSVLGIKSQRTRPTFGIKSWWLPAMAAGATVDVISKAEGVAYQTVYDALRKAGQPTNRRDAVQFLAAQSAPVSGADCSPTTPSLAD